VVFFFQKSFFLIKCSPNHFNFFVNFNIFHKKGSMCSNIQKIKIHNLFKFWYSNIFKHYYSFEFVIMVKVWCKKIEFLLCYMSYLASNLIFSLKNYIKMQYKPIENYHMENAILKKDFNFSVISFFFHVFTHMDYNLGFTLTFKCTFCYDFISIFFIRTQFMIHDEKNIRIKKITTKILTNK
jgi:hypothetical protein